MKALNFPHLRAAHLSCLFYCNFALELQLPLNFRPLTQDFPAPPLPLSTPLCRCLLIMSHSSQRFLPLASCFPFSPVINCHLKESGVYVTKITFGNILVSTNIINENITLQFGKDFFKNSNDLDSKEKFVFSFLMFLRNYLHFEQ